MLDAPLPLRELGLTIGALALWNALNYGPVHATGASQDAEVALHLAVDIAALHVVLYFTGGSTNPFVSLYLVPISLAATSLPARYAWLDRRDLRRGLLVPLVAQRAAAARGRALRHRLRSAPHRHVGELR